MFLFKITKLKIKQSRIKLAQCWLTIQVFKFNTKNSEKIRSVIEHGVWIPSEKNDEFHKRKVLTCHAQLTKIDKTGLKFRQRRQQSGQVQQFGISFGRIARFDMTQDTIIDRKRILIIMTNTVFCFIQIWRSYNSTTCHQLLFHLTTSHPLASIAK